MNHADIMPAGRVAEAGRAAAKRSTENRKPVRRDPEKRRQQNILAQKKYREKLRKRLDNLEAIAASVAINWEAGPATIPDAVPRDAVPPAVAPGQGGSPSSPLQQSPHLALIQNVNTFDSGSSTVATSDIESSSNNEAPELDSSAWDPTTSIDPSHLILDKYNDSISPFWVTDLIDCGCSVRHVQVRMNGPMSSHGCQIVSIGPSAIFADPFTSSLRIERMCFVDSMWANCLHIGVSLDAFCAEDAVSPFSRPTKTDIDDSANDNVVRTVQSIFKTLKPDLRPIREQILIQHPPFIDILPFPTLRKNFLRALGTMATETLFNDLLAGLICWGGAGTGKGDRDCSTGCASAAAPWECRSWEAKPWFIKKHWRLLGGEEGELVRQSEWWRSMRGEEAIGLLAL